MSLARTKIPLLKDLLACPACRGKLVFSDTVYCLTCARKYAQDSDIALNLLPDDLLIGKQLDIWRKRQKNYLYWLDNIWNKNLALESKMLYNQFFKYIGEINGSVLDIGCGSGVLRSYLGEVFYVGIDIFDQPDFKASANDFMSELFRFDTQECTFIKSAGELLPFGNAVFDNIFINNVLDHVYSPKKVLEEAWRALKDGGRLYIVHEKTGFLHKLSSKNLNQVFRSLVNRTKLLFLMRNFVPSHSKLNTSEFLGALKKSFLVETADADKGTHIFIRATKKIRMHND